MQELIFQNDYVGLKRYYEQEIAIIRKLQRIQEADVYPKVANSDAIAETEKEVGYFFNTEQVIAINTALSSNVSIITGPAGSGKSSIIKAIVKAYEPYSIALCSLSATAATRMTELSDHKASTIHKLLEYNDKGFTYNEDNHAGYWVYIVDEVSMQNNYVFKALIDAIELGAKIVIIGDHFQLPPIGAGAIFKNLLKSKFPVTHLVKIHRQESDSGIIVDSNKIKDHIIPASTKITEKWITHGNLRDMHYFFSTDKTRLFSYAKKSFLRGLEEFGIDETIIMTPMKDRGLNCTRELNKVMSNTVIPDAPFIMRGSVKFKVGDKIIQRVNDYHGKDVINGEIGYIDNIAEEDFTVRFNNRIVTYPKQHIKEIELAYAITTHLSQGRQWKAAITIIDPSHYVLLSNQLIYTAITRASKQCMLIADPQAVILAVKKNLNERKTFMEYLI